MPPGVKHSYDAIVIGSGPGGSTFAYALASKGAKVLVVERGDSLSGAGLSAPVSMAQFDRSRGWVGGDSKFFGAALYRFREQDFEATQHERGVSPAWPMSYAELEPFYASAERLYRVHGSSEGDRSEPPRSTPWPHPPVPHQGPVVDMVERLEARAKLSVSYIPRGIDYGESGTCRLCQLCDGYFCPFDAKMDAEVAALRPGLHTGNVTLLAHAECVRISTSTDGRRVEGVLVKTEEGDTRIAAPLVAASAGVLGTPTLLWRSRTHKHAKGLANSSGALGRFLAAHTQGWLFPLSRRIQASPFHQKTFAINEYYGSAPGWKFPLGTIQAAGYLEDGWRQVPFGARRVIRAILENSVQVFCMTEGLPTADSGFALSDEGPPPRVIVPPRQNPGSFRHLKRTAVEAFRQAGYRVVSPPVADRLWHAVGTARMGSDPSTSVVDARCKAHDVAGLFVVDASAIPTAGAVNSTLTIVALALKAGKAALESPA
jgi:choline dehydrogenase-like flavoprotein